MFSDSRQFDIVVTFALKMLRKIPLVVIFGSTGTGKTKLSIELAERFGGEIISADSMQVYKNLDVVTAKATTAEQARVPHHLLSVCSSAEPFTVVHFRNAALPIIDNLLSNNKIPIIVGGTNYYIESLLWDFVLGSPQDETPFHVFNEANEYMFEKLPLDELYNRLREVDPLTAKRTHPNNKRKLARALEVYHKWGVSLSTILAEQRSQPGGNRLGGPLRYQHVILFSLQCDQEILNNRLNQRVDCMLEQGLLQEVRNFYENANVQSGSNTFTKGILQTIGLKEFFPYLQKFNREQDVEILEFLQKRSFVLSDEKLDDEPEGLDLLRMCLKDLKLVTQRYSKKQIKWVKNRFLGSKDRHIPPLYALNTTSVAEWNENVYLPAVDVIESYIYERTPKLEPLSTIEHPSEGMDEDTSFYCDICKRHFVGEYQWNLHLKSNKHKRVKDGQRRKKNRENSELNTK